MQLYLVKSEIENFIIIAYRWSLVSDQFLPSLIGW